MSKQLTCTYCGRTGDPDTFRQVWAGIERRVGGWDTRYDPACADVKACAARLDEQDREPVDAGPTYDDMRPTLEWRAARRQREYEREWERVVYKTHRMGELP